MYTPTSNSHWLRPPWMAREGSQEEWKGLADGVTLAGTCTVCGEDMGGAPTATTLFFISYKSSYLSEKEHYCL